MWFRTVFAFDEQKDQTHLSPTAEKTGKTELKVAKEWHKNKFNDYFDYWRKCQILNKTQLYIQAKIQLNTKAMFTMLIVYIIKASATISSCFRM